MRWCFRSFPARAGAILIYCYGAVVAPTPSRETLSLALTVDGFADVPPSSPTRASP